METTPPQAPSVVTVMVVHDPGDWFDDVIDSLAAQDYPNLRCLFLVTDRTDVDAVSARITSRLPTAFVRPLGGNPGFGPAANEVLRFVEGDNGFFLTCHDDVALAPDATRLMVEELFRSNAGMVGPKLVDWDEPRRLQHVGLGLDRFGEVDPVIDPGEFDQEQHDGVRDVFVLPSACLLVRADLFRTLAGFDPAIGFHGEDIEICWRAHLTGARVIVAPDAVVRHRERLDERRPDLPHRALASRHRMRAVAVLTAGSRLLIRSIQLVLLTIVELVVGLFTGRFPEAVSSLRALGGLIPRTPALVVRRRTIRPQRIVHEREIHGLQSPGSARLTSYMRGRETATYVAEGAAVKRWRETSFGPVVAWICVVIAVIVGSREFITGGVPNVGEFLPFPESPQALWDAGGSGFDGRGFGSTAATPTTWSLLPILSALVWFRMALLETVIVVGAGLVGAFGAWRLATVFPVNRARVAGMVVYIGTPLLPGMLSQGDLTGLVWYAALPWLVHLTRRVAGLEAADPTAVASDMPDGVADILIGRRVRSMSYAVLVAAFAGAFAPVTLLIWPAVVVVLAVATLLAGGSWRVAGWFVVGGAVSTVGGALLNLPWTLEWSRADLLGPALAGSTGRSIAEVASLAPTTERFALLAVALYLPLMAAIAIARAWRLTWAVRGGALVAVFGTAMVLAERGAAPFDLPPTPLLAAPVALGLALGAAAIAGGFGSDVLGRGFGWRQPVALLANVAIVVGLLPAAVAIGDGAWNAPSTPLPRLLDAQLTVDPAEGDYRVLYVGDPRVIPVPSRSYADGIAYAVVDGGPLDVADRSFVPATSSDAAVEQALGLISSGSTLRAGRLLAPLGIRYVVVPTVDGVESTSDDPIPVPQGLLAAIENQLDIGAVYGSPQIELFLNRAWFPVGAELGGVTAEASERAGVEAIVRSDLSDAAVAMFGADTGDPVATDTLGPGTLHLAIPFDERIDLTVDGVEIQSRSSFGTGTAFDVSAAGDGVLDYDDDGHRPFWRIGQAAAWLIVLLIGAGARTTFGRRLRPGDVDETLIDLDDVDEVEPVVVESPGEVGDDTGQIAGEVLAGALPTDDQPDLASEGPPGAAHGPSGEEERP